MPDAERDAQQLLETVTGRKPSDVELPVDPFSIAKNLGIQVFLDAGIGDDVSGMLIRQGPGHDPQILLNPYDSRNRQRFTCAHELGHFNHHAQAGDEGAWRYVDRRDYLSSRGDDPHEIYANQFAAALLMPEQLVKKLAKAYDVDVAALAYKFGVSADAMNFRLKNLGLK